MGLLALLNMMNPYTEREYSLIELGFRSYKQYLASGLWKRIRAKVKGVCLRCGKPRTCVHHVSYDIETMRGERLDTLIPSCGRCHRTAERHGKACHDPVERLNEVTAFLMEKRRSQRRRQRRAENAKMTWRVERAIPRPLLMEPSKKTLQIQEWTRKVAASRVPFDPTPRLVRTGQ